MSVQQLLQPSAQLEPWASLYLNSLHCGVSSGTSGSVISASSDAKLGFYGAAPVVKGVAGAQASVSSAGSTNANTETTYTGGSGSSAYSVGQIVLILKNLGLIAM